jgi:AraC-like DNA-binding protein/CheY-like chemotaxis protein
MAELNSARWQRYQLVTFAHDFLLAVLPFRYPRSTEALARFSACVAEVNTTGPETEVVLLDVLAVINGHARCPNLLDRYVAARRHRTDPMGRFHECVDELIRHRAIGDRHVERALAVIETRYRDDTLTHAKVAELAGLSPSDLSTRFSQQTGMTFTEYVRNTRLDRAASLLLSTDRRIKDIWVSVGYNDASNFDHQFKERYGLSPRDYRRRAIGSSPEANVQSPRQTEPQSVSSTGTVLIVEDHENTRETVGRYLRAAGCDVVLSSTGEEGLDAASRMAPRTVVLDYHLPDMDGLTWLRALRQRERESRARVLLFTADWDVVEHAEEIEVLGATYVSKLCDIDELVQLIGACPRTSPAAWPRDRN